MIAVTDALSSAIEARKSTYLTEKESKKRKSEETINVVVCTACNRPGIWYEQIERAATSLELAHPETLEYPNEWGSETTVLVPVRKTSPLVNTPRGKMHQACMGGR